MNNNKTTMDFLQMQHAQHCGLLDDKMGNDFYLWLSELDEIAWVTIMSQYAESIIHDMKEKVSRIKVERLPGDLGETVIKNIIDKIYE